MMAKLKTIFKTKLSKGGLVASILIITLTTVLFLSTTLIGRSIDLPVKISSVNQLDKIRDDLSGYYLIVKDLDMSQYVDDNGNEKLWVPIGSKDAPFTGKIDFNYHYINGLRFSEDYIAQQNKSNNDEILIGFLGCSQGTIIHAKFYHPVLPNIADIIETRKSVVFGTVCAINKGYVTTCSVEMGPSGLFGGYDFVFGLLVGRNQKQLLNDLCINSINIRCFGKAIVGGIVGETYAGSTNSYLVRRGYTTIRSYSNLETIIGGISGQDYGGDFLNVFHGPSNLNQRENLSVDFSDLNSNKVHIGGLIGYLSGENITSVENAYCCNTISLKNTIATCSIGGLFGSNCAKLCFIKSCVEDSFFNFSNSTNNKCGTVCGQNLGSIDSNNSYYISNSTITDIMNTDYATKTSFDALSFDELNWPNNVTRGYWTKASNIFYLTVL